MGRGREDSSHFRKLPDHSTGEGWGTVYNLKPHRSTSQYHSQQKAMNLVTGASKPSGLPVLAVERGTVASVLRAVDHTSYTDRDTS